MKTLRKVVPPHGLEPLEPIDYKSIARDLAVLGYKSKLLVSRETF